MKKPKQTKSEGQLIREYAEKVMRGKASRGHVDKRFGFTKTAGTVNKELWLDTDFFFSVVFQSEAQKYEFLNQLGKKLGIHEDKIDEGQTVQIVNGLKLADALGIKLQREKAAEFPYGPLDLRPYIMDDEAL